MLYQELGFLDRFGAAAVDGFRGVEFVSGYAFPPDVVAAAAEAAGVEVVLLNSPAGDWAAGERGFACQPGRERTFKHGIEDALKYAKALRCQQIHIMAGIVPDSVTPAEAQACFVANLRWAVERLAEAGITALIEPINGVDMPGYGLSSLGQAERVLSAVGHPNLRLQFDFYHMAMMDEPLVEQFQRLLPVIGHVQVADMPGRHEPGSGQVDFAAVFGALDSFPGWVGAEYGPAAWTSAGLGWMKNI